MNEKWLKELSPIINYNRRMNDIIIEQLNNIILKNEMDNPNIKPKHKSKDEDYVKNYNKMYYEKNKLVRKEISDKNNIIFTCDCGKRVKFNSLNYHRKTEYHQLYKTQ